MSDSDRNRREIERMKLVYTAYDQSPYESTKRDLANSGNKRRLIERYEALHQMILRRLSETGTHVSDVSVVDFGCGWGELLVWFAELGVRQENLTGIELLPGRLDVVRKKLPGAHLIEGDASRVTLPSRFDFACSFTVFSSILDDAMRSNLAQSLRSALKPTGAVVWYDFRYPNPWNSHTLAMTRSRVSKLFPGFGLHLETVTLIPQIARTVGRNERIHHLLSWLPVMRSHYIGLLLPPEGQA
jgi:cyclopropane fatty-acyl-phospholipid synthase-like methyltransferase